MSAGSVPKRQSAAARAAAALIVTAFRDPQALARFSLAEWDLLLHQSDKSMLMAALHALACEHGLLDALPAPVRTHLAWADTLGQRHRAGVHWEITQIRRALGELGVQIVLLKGAAYTMGGLAAGRGRLYSDIDILVPRARLDEVESALLINGWASARQDPYDERYYREWMHELPPMVHLKRQSAIDVHHAILPLTAAARPDSARLLAQARPLRLEDHADSGAGPGGARHDPLFQVLAPCDMVLHSAVHLFHDEFAHGLRDLIDIHRLLGEFGTDPGFWEALPARAAELQLGRSLFYALRYAERLLGTPVPASVRQQVRAFAPAAALLALMDALLLRALLPHHPSCKDRYTGVARFLLYLRANWLRMPPILLARHLFHKAFLSPKQ